MRGRTLDIDADLEDSPAATPPSFHSPEREAEKNITGTDTLVTSVGSTESTVEISQPRLSEEGPFGEKR